jgi:hypothetical protein
LCHPALAALCLVVVRPQGHVIGHVSKFLLSVIAASVLLFLVRRSVELAVASDRPLRIAAFPLTTAVVVARLAVAGDFNPNEPILSCRFQLPPPIHTA